MTTLYLVRHGENKANLTREFSCRLVDYSLTPRGVVQAEQTAAYFKELPLGGVYTSPLKRAVETAAIIARPLGLEVQVLEQFREINVGDLEREPPTDENWDYHNRIFRSWLAGQHELTFPGGENYLILLARMQAGLQEVLSRTPNQPSVIVAHAGIFRATIENICRNGDEPLLLGRLQNCSITEIEAGLREGQLVAHLRRWATCDHLSGEAA